MSTAKNKDNSRSLSPVKKKSSSKVTSVTPTQDEHPVPSAEEELLKPRKIASKKNKTSRALEKSIQDMGDQDTKGRRTTHRKRKLTKAEREHFTTLLMESMEHFKTQLRYHSDEVLSSGGMSAAGELGMATHMADLGSDNYQHDFGLSLLSEEGDVLLMIEEALQKIKDNEYGICMHCGCEIPVNRLEAKPYARFCTKCKERQERLEDPGRRHR